MVLGQTAELNVVNNAQIDQLNEQARADFDAWWDRVEDTLTYRVEVSRSTGEVSVVPITTDGEDAVLHSHDSDVLGYGVLSEIKSRLSGII
jgi:sugar (pentulose or hexulose) kinase